MSCPPPGPYPVNMMDALFATPNRRIVACAVVATAAGLAALVMVPAAVRSIFSSNFLPHAYCYLQDRDLIALHLGSDAVIWLSYVAISCTLVYLVWRTRREIPFSWMFLAFGTFIVACGFTHFMEMVVLWKPLYWLSADIKLLTALASLITAIALPTLIPQVHGMVAAAHLSEERKAQLEQANGELQRLSAQVMNVQDAERRRLARELHDGVGQYLAAIKMSCDVALAEAKGRSDVISHALHDTVGLVDRCTAEVRTMSHLLHPPLLEEMGLSLAIPWFVDGFEQRSGIRVELNMPEDLGRLSQSQELGLFRVLQESLTNIHRHSKSTVAIVRIRAEASSLLLDIADRGIGFRSRNGNPPNAGVGIAGMRERIRELGGEFSIDSGPGGTTVRAVIPVGKGTERVEANSGS
ncbi:MAG: sensor histidine kinase [Terriglobales bacterium]